MRPAAKLLSCLVKVVYCFVSIKFVHFQVANVLFENVKYLFCFVQVYVPLCSGKRERKDLNVCACVECISHIRKQKKPVRQR
jgi:hypothetical protein